MANSNIITQLPTRLLEQQLNNTEIGTYPLMELVRTFMIANGRKQYIYNDYRDVSSLSAFSNVSITDFNKGIEPLHTDEAKTSIEVSKGYDILDLALNDVAMTPGLFAAMTNNFMLAITRPYQKYFFKRFMSFLDTKANYDETITLAKGINDVKGMAKEIYTKLITLQTPSRDTLAYAKKKYAKGFEYAYKPSNFVLILDSKYASNYKYDLAAGTFQLAEIQLPVGETKIFDFETLGAQSTSNAFLKDQAAILMEKGVYNELVHFKVTKMVDTPKAKKVFNRYDMIGNYRVLNKLLIAFKAR